MIIDFHAHIKRNPISQTYDVDDLFADMERNSIRKRVVSALWGPDISAQNDFIRSLCHKHSDKLIPCAIINPKQENAVYEVDRILKQGFRIIEMNSLEHGYRPEKVEYNILPILELCQDNNTLVKIFTGQGAWSMPDQWVYYTKKYPKINFVIEHLGGVDFRYGTIVLADEHDNLFFETSEENERTSLKLWLNQNNEDKLLYGSNYPTNYTNLSILKFKEFNLSSKVKEKIFYKNASKLLQINENEVNS